MKKAIGYVFSRPIKGARVPQRVQNLVIRDFCANRRFEFQLSRVEYVNENGFSILMSLQNDLSEQTFVVMYSLFQLPKVQKVRYSIYDFIFQEGSQIWFALEGLSVECKGDIQPIDDILAIQKFLEHPKYNQSLATIRDYYAA